MQALNPLDGYQEGFSSALFQPAENYIMARHLLTREYRDCCGGLCRDDCAAICSPTPSLAPASFEEGSLWTCCGARFFALVVGPVIWQFVFIMLWHGSEPLCSLFTGAR